MASPSQVLAPVPNIPPYENYDVISNGSDSIIEALILSYVWLASSILLVMSIHHVRKAISRRLWFFPSHASKLFALNAGTLALLSIAAKPPNDTSPDDFIISEFSKLLGAVLICTVTGACMPSIASRDMKDMWSNVAGVTLLLITTIVNIYLQLTRHVICHLIGEHFKVMLLMGMLLLVLWMQALALEAMMSDVRAILSDQLGEIRNEARPGFKSDVVQERPWTWDVMQRESEIKLMMALTSSPENVVARSPSAAVVGVLALCSVLIVLKAELKDYERGSYFILLQGPTIVLCGFICVWRWARVALHKDRPFLSLLLDAEPSYWSRKLRTMRHNLRSGPRRQPNVLEEAQYGFKESLLYTAAFLLLTIILIQRILVAITRFWHNLSALLMQLVVWPFEMVWAQMCCASRRGSAERHAIPSSSIVPELRVTTASSIDLELAAPSSMDVLNELQGVICLAGEDTFVVQRQFDKAVTYIIHKQIKGNLDHLIRFLIKSSSPSMDSCLIRNSGISCALDRRGAPDVKGLHVEHGYQYGWSLTLVSLLAVLTRLEMETLAKSEAIEEAMDAYWQAREMVKVVDEQYTPSICWKETYVAASALVWSTLPKKRRWSQKRGGRSAPLDDLKNPSEVLEALRLPAERHIREFNETKRQYVAAAWPQEMVMAYTMHTLCNNLLQYWSQNGAVAGGNREIFLVEYVSFLIADMLAGCLSNLPIAISACTTDAVRGGHTRIVEESVLLAAQGKKLWEELQWPTPCAPAANTFGLLCQWF